jgi:hypothetical protein
MPKTRRYKNNKRIQKKSKRSKRSTLKKRNSLAKGAYEASSRLTSQQVEGLPLTPEEIEEIRRREERRRQLQKEKDELENNVLKIQKIIETQEQNIRDPQNENIKEELIKQLDFMNKYLDILKNNIQSLNTLL